MSNITQPNRSQPASGRTHLVRSAPEVNELATAVAEAADAAGHPRDSQPARLEVEVAVSNHDKVPWHRATGSLSLWPNWPMGDCFLLGLL